MVAWALMVIGYPYLFSTSSLLSPLVLSWLKHVQSTPQNTCNPRWDEPLSFQIPTGSLVDAQLHLRVIGKQKLRDDLVLGRMELPLAGVKSAGGRGEAEGGSWFELLDGQGRLKIDAELVTRRPSLIV